MVRSCKAQKRAEKEIAMRAQIVSFHCVLRSQVGNQVLSSTFNHDVITQIEGGDAEGMMLRGLAEGLQGLKKGEKRQIFLDAKQAYGFYEPGLVKECPRQEISNGSELEVGAEVVMRSPDGEKKVFRVVEATRRTITLDGNHPLAGMDLVFDIEATEAREATKEEIADSRPDAPSGHTRLLH
jgi:FKBP-type peptidyl-prolyl cis-trans isomerase SlyD